MTKAEQIVLSLIRQSLWGSEAETLTDELRDEVLQEATAQAVLGLIPQLSEDNDLQQIGAFIQYTFAEEELTDIFKNADIPLVILKGSAAAIYYPQPFRRSMGDFDFIVPTDYFEEAQRLLKKSGYTPHFIPRKVEREIQFVKDGYEYELHYRFSDSDLDIEKYIVQGMKHIVNGKIEDHQFPMLPPFSNGMVLLAHMRHHLLMGLGLRQMIDWMMFCDKVLDDTFWEKEFRSAAEETGLDTLAITATYLCQKYLGLKKDITWCQNAEESLCDTLIDNLLSSGNFGEKHGKGNDVEKTVTNFQKQGVFSYLQKAGETNWRSYHRHPFLKPFCWAYQVFRYMKQGFSRIGNLNKDMKRSYQRFKMLQRLNLVNKD